MKTVIPVLLALFAIAAAVAAAWYFLNRSVPGAPGSVVVEQRKVLSFSRVAIEGFADVTLIQGAHESVTLEAPSKQLPSVHTDVSEGTLTIRNDQARRWWSGILGGGIRPLRVTVTFRDIDSIKATGGVKIRVEQLRADQLKISASGATSLRIGDLDAKALWLSGSGAMKVEMIGRAATQTISISGAADYRAADLVSDDASVEVSGAGRVVVQAEKTLKIDLSGAGSVEYIGNPKVTQRVSGAGRVKRREASEGGFVVAYAESASPPSGP